MAGFQLIIYGRFWVFTEDQVVIRYPAQARLFKKEAQADGISVAYETAP